MMAELFSHSPHSGFQILGCVVQEYADFVEDEYIRIDTGRKM